MGAFKSAVITKKGQELLAKVVAGTTKLEFTKIKVSDTKLSGDLASMTGIGTIKQEEKVASVVRKNGSNVTVSASFSNQTLGQGYYVRNLGLYANDPQAGEILYSISVADESTATSSICSCKLTIWATVAPAVGSTFTFTLEALDTAVTRSTIRELTPIPLNGGI